MTAGSERSGPTSGSGRTRTTAPSSANNRPLWGWRRMLSRAISPDGQRLLRAGLAGSKRPLWIISGWSVLEAGPALAAGWVTAASLDRGFLAGRSAIGVAWLTLLAALLVLRAAAGQAMFPHLAAVIEPLRDHLVRTVVGGTLARAADLAT